MSHKGDCIKSTKLVVGPKIINIVCVYTPQIRLGEDVKRLLWEELDEFIWSIPQPKRLFIRVTLMGI